MLYFRETSFLCCIYLPRAEILGMSHHARFYTVLGINPGFCENQANTLLTELHPEPQKLILTDSKQENGGRGAFHGQFTTTPNCQRHQVHLSLCHFVFMLALAEECVFRCGGEISK